MMEHFDTLPFELKEYIFRFLTPHDLWTCLFVSSEWRRVANSIQCWRNICNNEYIDTECLVDQEEDDSLCKYALLWKENELTVSRWRSNGFKEQIIPHKNSEELTCREIYTHQKMMAVITNTKYKNSGDNILHIHSFDNYSNVREEIALSFIKPHAVTINDNYVIISSGNIVVTYKKDNSYKLYLGVAFCVDSRLYLATKDIPEFALRNFHNDPYIRIEALLNEYLWLSCLISFSGLLYVINLHTLQLSEIRILSRLVCPTKKYVLVSTFEDLQIFTYRGELVSKLNVQGGFKATDDFIVTSPEQGQPITIWTIKGKELRVIPGPVSFELDPIRHCLYECTQEDQRNLEENCKLSAICLRTGACVWCTEIKKSRLSEIDDMYQVCARFLIIDFYKEQYTPNFHHAFVYDLDKKILLYKTVLDGYTMRVSKNLWVLKREDELIVQIY